MPLSLVPTKAHFFLDIVAPTLLPFQTGVQGGDDDTQSSTVDAIVGFNQLFVTLTGELSSSSVLVAEARFISHGLNQILAGIDKFF